MDAKLTLANCATLVYRESLMDNKQSNSRELIRSAIDTVKIADTSLTLSHTSDVLLALKQTVLELNSYPHDHAYDKATLLQRFKLNCGDDEGLYNVIEAGIDSEVSEDTNKRTVLNLRKALHHHISEEKVREILSKHSYRINNQRDSIHDLKSYVSELISTLEPYQVTSSDTDPAIINRVSLENLQEITDVYDSVKKEESGQNIFRTGWQGVNRMLDGGFRRGEMWVLGALQHKWKTGFSLSLFSHFCLYNTPVLKDPTKKPLLLRISLEDPIESNFKFLYRSLKQNETGRVTTTVGVPSAEMAAYVKQRLTATGFHVELLEVNPSLWTYKSLLNLVLEYESKGYEVQCVMVDYQLKIPTTGCTIGPLGTDIRNQYERIKADFSAKRILYITPHQLSPEAKKEMIGGATEFVKQLVDKGLFSGTKQLDQVVDGELYFHIERLNKEAYFTIQRGKHRKVEQTDEEHTYYVYKFVKNGTIPDDIDKPDTARNKVAGPMICEGGGSAFHQYDDSPI